MKIELNARNRAYHFDAAPDERILYAGLSEAVALPYECGSGTCGTCKARLLSGEVDDRWPEAPGRKFLKRPDEFLMCQCVAKGDVCIEVASFVHGFDPGAFVPAAIKGVIRDPSMLTHDVMQLYVDIKQPMEFEAGQFALVQVPGVMGFRGWSMVDYVPGAKTLRFVVKKLPGGRLSDWLFSNPRAGIEVDVFGPLGVATFYPAIDKNIVCIAGGTGIAGMMAILARAASENYFADHDGDVFFGVRTMKDAFYLDEFARFREQCGERMRVTVALSETAASEAEQAQYPKLRFDFGFVHEVAGRALKDRLQNVRAYLAGPPPAVDASVRMLLMSRVSTDNIRYDKFS